MHSIRGRTEKITFNAQSHVGWVIKKTSWYLSKILITIRDFRGQKKGCAKNTVGPEELSTVSHGTVTPGCSLVKRIEIARKIPEKVKNCEQNTSSHANALLEKIRSHQGVLTHFFYVKANGLISGYLKD